MIRGKGRLELMIRLEITSIYILVESVDRVIPRVTYCTSK